MSLPEIVSPDEWRAARLDLLAKEKELTRTRDALNAERRRLPMVRVGKDYRFEGPEGELGLADLFEGRRQLILRHFMFKPEWDDGCPSCSAAADEISDGLLEHLHVRDTSFATVSRAPLAKLEDYKARKGWTFPWFSSSGSDFNYDFHVTVPADAEGAEYNYRTVDEHRARGTGYYFEGDDLLTEQPGASMFLRAGDDVFHTYSLFARGAEMFGGSYYWLDLTALGRQEEWEEPKGRAESARAAMPDFAG